MVKLAIADNPAFELSREDIDRPPPSYTADLLRALAGPDRELFFIVGADIIPELHRWRAPAEILQLARLAVVHRPGSPTVDVSALERELPGAGDRVDVVDSPGVAISAREIRARIRDGWPIRYLTPGAVEEYIDRRRLYR